MNRHLLCTTILLSLLAVVVAGCGRLPAFFARNQESASKTPQATCTNAFVPHALDFTTSVRSQPVRMFDSNGAGVAVDDLDNDGDIDIVLANLGGPNAVLWNEGGLTFRKQAFPYGDARAATIVDVDGDGWRDVVFSNRLGAPLWWQNTGVSKTPAVSEASESLSDRFVYQPLSGVVAPAYAMAWGDLDQDGDLDAVVNNLMAPAMIYENQLCTGAALEVDLFQPASQNTRAWGAQLTLHTSHGRLTRTVRTTSGYASGGPARVHFGFPAASQLIGLDIRWPDGATSSVSQLAPNTRMTITRR